MKYVPLKNSDEKIPIGKIVCMGQNYAKHALELGGEVPEFPLIFLKTTTCLIPSGGEVIHPDYSEDMHHEIELVLLIGNDVKNADDKEAEEAIAGYAVGLDMTLRDLQRDLKSKGSPWTLAKVFDTSGVLSEFILKDNYKLKGNESIKLSVNGKARQDSSIDTMLFSPVEIVKYISQKMTLEKGDLIFTGTPEGVGRVVPGDYLEGSIEGVGNLTAKIVGK
jgi:5-carboxymethyl-2-hydroxymuconate isomerase